MTEGTKLTDLLKQTDVPDPQVEKAHEWLLKKLRRPESVAEFKMLFVRNGADHWLGVGTAGEMTQREAIELFIAVRQVSRCCRLRTTDGSHSAFAHTPLVHLVTYVWQIEERTRRASRNKELFLSSVSAIVTWMRNTNPKTLGFKQVKAVFKLLLAPPRAVYCLLTFSILDVPMAAAMVPVGDWSIDPLQGTSGTGGGGGGRKGGPSRSSASSGGGGGGASSSGEAPSAEEAMDTSGGPSDRGPEPLSFNAEDLVQRQAYRVVVGLDQQTAQARGEALNLLTGKWTAVVSRMRRQHG